ncbi:MAG: hypothetical protein OXG37_00070 [Actinomycetia bacterium]|nr:hypothetical protein [Actinomycetes bacterium]
MAPVAAAVLACGSLPGQDVSAPGNQSYHFEGLATVVTWDASAGATHYRVFYDEFFADNCELYPDGSPGFCEELAGNVVGTSYTHTSPAREGNYYWVVACDDSGCSEVDSQNAACLSGPLCRRVWYATRPSRSLAAPPRRR